MFAATLLITKVAGEYRRTVARHWEGDLIIGARNRTAVVTLTERVTRHTLLAALPNGYRAPHTAQAISDAFSRVPKPLQKTLTWDQGREMSEWCSVEQQTGLSVLLEAERRVRVMPTKLHQYGMNTWSTRCSGSCTSGSQGRAGPGNPPAEKAGRAPRSDPTQNIPPGKRKVYCAVVLDVVSRRVVGWSIDNTATSGLVTSALGMAIGNRHPGTVIHSDQAPRVDSRGRPRSPS